jgi:hypothetical protein
LENFCSSLLGHLQTLLYFPTVLDFRTFLSVDIVTLFYPLSFCDKKWRVIFDLDRDCIFNRSSDFCPRMAKGGVC